MNVAAWPGQPESSSDHEWGANCCSSTNSGEAVNAPTVWQLGVKRLPHLQGWRSSRLITTFMAVPQTRYTTNILVTKVISTRVVTTMASCSHSSFPHVISQTTSAPASMDFLSSKWVKRCTLTYLIWHWFVLNSLVLWLASTSDLKSWPGLRQLQTRC